MSRFTVPKGKVQLKAYISKEVYSELISIAPKIYGKGKGGISYVVEEALRQYLAPRAHAQIHTNPTHSTRLIYEAVVEKAREILCLDFKPKEIPEKILEQAISEVRGGDPRTIKRWKHDFERQGLIKCAGGKFPNRIFELL